jgi:hypothetical protein
LMRFFLVKGPNLAKPRNSADQTLSSGSNCAGVHTDSSLFSFDHAFRPDSIAFWSGFGPPVRSQFGPVTLELRYHLISWALIMASAICLSLFSRIEGMSGK